MADKSVTPPSTDHASEALTLPSRAVVEQMISEAKALAGMSLSEVAWATMQPPSVRYRLPTIEVASAPDHYKMRVAGKGVIVSVSRGVPLPDEEPRVKSSLAIVDHHL